MLAGATPILESSRGSEAGALLFEAAKHLTSRSFSSSSRHVFLPGEQLAADESDLCQLLHASAGAGSHHPWLGDAYEWSGTTNGEIEKPRWGSYDLRYLVWRTSHRPRQMDVSDHESRVDIAMEHRPGSLQLIHNGRGEKGPNLPLPVQGFYPISTILYNNPPTANMSKKHQHIPCKKHYVRTLPLTNMDMENELSTTKQIYW